MYSINGKSQVISYQCAKHAFVNFVSMVTVVSQNKAENM